MTSVCTSEQTIIQRAEFYPPFAPNIHIDVPIVQQFQTTVTVLHLGPMTHATFISVNIAMLIAYGMPQLTDFKLVLEPPRAGSGDVLPLIIIRAGFFPALRDLHLEGSTLVCDSLSLLRRLELRNPTNAPLAGHTFADFLATLSTGEALEELVLENYMGSMGAGDPIASQFSLASCKTAFVKDTSWNLRRFLAHLSAAPEDLHVEVWFAVGIPRVADVDLPLPTRLSPFLQPVHCATFQFLSNGVQLICAGPEHRITIECCITAGLVNVTSTIHTMALHVLMRFLNFMPVSTLEIIDAIDSVDLRAWFDLFMLTPNLSELLIRQQGPGGAVCNIFTALASLGGQAVETPVRCPYLKHVKVRSTTYSPLLVTTIGQSVKWRAEHRGPLRSLELVLAPRFDGKPQCELASNAAREWAVKLEGSKYVNRIIVKDATGGVP